MVLAHKRNAYLLQGAFIFRWNPSTNAGKEQKQQQRFWHSRHASHGTRRVHVPKCSHAGRVTALLGKGTGPRLWIQYRKQFLQQEMINDSSLFFSSVKLVRSRWCEKGNPIAVVCKGCCRQLCACVSVLAPQRKFARAVKICPNGVDTGFLETNEFGIFFSSFFFNRRHELVVIDLVVYQESDSLYLENSIVFPLWILKMR